MEDTLINYVVSYLLEELDRSGQTDTSPKLIIDLVKDALDAHERGAR